MTDSSSKPPKGGSRRRRAEAETMPGPKRAKKRRERLARRHPDIEMARLLVKRGFVDKAAGVEALKLQKARAKNGKPRIPFLRLLVKRRILDAGRLADAQDEIRRHTYLCDHCNARAVVLAGSQSRAGACPRCGQEISVAPPTDGNAFPVREFVRPEEDTGALSKTEDVASWRPLGSRWRRGLPLGELAFDKYLVEAELGRGAMGVVYRATHMQLDKPIALKVLFPDEEAWEHQVARFRREAAAVQKLKHPNIVAVHDFGGDGELYYLTMDVVEGGESLHTALKNFAEPKGLRWRLETLVEVSRAAAHAHEHGIIHRDLKPANVLIDSAKGAQVADFGLAKDEAADAAELTRTHDRLGTPLFMAPEQIRKGAATVDKRADVWALGVMLFVCVTGRYPFRSRTVMDLYLRILREQPDWYGDRFSAPERKGIAPKAAPTDKTLIESGSSSDTQISTRDSNGEIPKTRDGPNEPPRIAPPPFSAPPELLDKKIPEDLKAVIQCALAKDPDDRYATASTFADDIEAFLAGRKVSGGGPGLLKRVRMQFWRRRVLRPLVLGLVLLTLSVLLLGGIAFRQREAELKLDADVDAAWARASDRSGEGQRLAEDALTKILASNDAHPRALLRRGMVRVLGLRFADARGDLERAAAVAGGAAQDPMLLLLKVRAAQGFLELLAGEGGAAFQIVAGALGNADAAAALRDAFGVREDLCRTLSLAAFESGSEEQLAFVEARLAEVCKDPRATAELHALYGRLALQRGDLLEAKARLERGAGTVEHLETTLLRGAIQLAGGERASSTYARARKAYPERGSVDVQFFGEAALASFREGDWQRNLDVNAAAARLTPWCGRTHYYCGNVLLHRLVDTEGALAAFRTAWQRDPFDEVSYDYYLSLLLTRSDRPKRLEEAASAIRYEELELRPKNPNPPLRLAYVHIRQGRLVQAWEALDRADERTSRGLRKKGLRSGLARGAILRVAGPDQLGLLDRLGTWRDVTAEDWERGYHAPNAEDAVTDALAVSRIFLEGGSPQRALDLLDEAARRSLKKENVPHPKAQRMRSAVVTLKAWALAALGMAAPAKAKLRSVLDIKTRLTAQAAPDVLRSVPEFRALFAEDEELRNLVETLAARRKEAN